jgi:urea transport system substrate-binding protein
VFEELNGLLFYPVQYEGEESSYNVYYTGAAPNQQAIPAVEYLMSAEGGGAKRWVLLGTDYVYPRTTNKILNYFLKEKGVAKDDIMEKYTPFGHSDYQTIVADIKKFAAGKPTAVVSTINGDSNVPFYKELANQGLKAEDIPVVAFSVGEEELRGLDTKPLVGHLAAWNYFMSLDNPTNTEFKNQWAAYVKEKKLPEGDKRVTNDPMEATWIGIQMWKQAVEQAGTTDINAVRQAVGGQTVMGWSGRPRVQCAPRRGVRSFRIAPRRWRTGRTPGSAATARSRSTKSRRSERDARRFGTPATREDSSRARVAGGLRAGVRGSFRERQRTSGCRVS